MWNLEVAEGQNIKLTIESFDLEPALCYSSADYSSTYGSDYRFKDMSRNTKSDCGECLYDYVQISYGSVEEKYCGSDLPEPIISSGNTMTVTFVSDGSVEFTGFSATWEAVDGGSSGTTGEG